ncbi:MAG: hypothetical protein ACXWXO_16540 [Nocardioides sp.]
MNTDEILRSSMDQAVRDLQSPVPDPAVVRARVNRASRVHALAAVGLAAALVAGVFVGVDTARDGGRSAPPPPAATQDAADIDVEPLWMADGVLHLGDKAYPQEKEIATALVPVKSGAVFGASDGTVVYQPFDGPARVIDYPDGRDITWGPAAGPDTDVVAMFVFSKIDSAYDLSMYDLERDREITAMPRYDFVPEGTGNPFGGEPMAPIDWVGADPAGGYSALYTGPRLDYSEQREDPVKGDPVVSRMHPRGYRGAATSGPLTPAAYDVTINVLVDVRGNGLSFRTPGEKLLSTVNGVEADGGLSHDGDLYAGSDPEGGIAVVDTRTGTTRHIDAPEGTAHRHLSWASGHTLMFHAVDDAGASSAGSVMACNADTLLCANVADVDDIETVVLPRL